MKLGFVSAILAEYSFEQVVDFASEYGIACVEMMSWPRGKSERRYAGVTHIDAETMDEGKAEYINEYLAKRNVSISGIGYYPNPLDANLEQRTLCIEHIKKCIKTAKTLGLSTMNTFIGRDPLSSISDSMKQFQKVWPDIVKFAEDYNVRIGIENCPMYFRDEWPGGKNLAASPSIWREMFSTIESDCFGLNYDPSHLVWQRMDYLKPIYEFKEKLFHFHIKDAKLFQDRYDDAGIFAAPLDYHAPKLPGLGDIDWGKTVSALKDVGYDGAMVMEIEDRAFENTLEDKLKAIRLSKQFMNQYIL
ncbi:MAG: sugar phosphate isomerase/epimerase [Clostridia bacterium]|nr:sugar phosphate isomerase/epimerase [Clostridia bacterium]